MSRKIIFAAVIFVLLISFTGCIRNTSTIVGEWYSEKDNVRLFLNEDGTFNMTDESLEDKDLLAGKYRVEGDKFYYTPTDEGELVNNYTLKNDTLTLTYQEYTSVFKRVVK